MSSDAFFDRRRTPAIISGEEVALPILYRDASVVTAFFRVDHGKAADLLAGTPVTPVRFAGDKAIAAVVAYDYRDTSIGAYREVATVLAVVPRGAPAPSLPLLHLLRTPAREVVGWYVLDLPVTTAIADAAGRALWGFPKFQTPIEFEESGARVRVAVRAPSGDEPILVLEGRRRAGLPLGALDLVIYTVREGELLRTFIETRGRMHTCSGAGLTLRVGRADHAMARRLAALGLDGAHPMAAQRCGRFQSVLPAGTVVRAGAARAA